ncbi:MAG: hypothetical protein MR355_03090 [Lachnospiraceae bacterium]|nr:hypothetical protein [Lachnospiraceae bacterium]
MSKTEKNKEIVKMVEKRIKERGYEGKLEMDPISNTFKRRNHFTKKADGTGVFTAFMWQMNSLSDDELVADIDDRISEAAEYFGL